MKTLLKRRTTLWLLAALWLAMAGASYAEPEVDLAVTIDDTRNFVQPGDEITYIVTVSNAGPANVSGSVVTVLLPSALLDGRWSSTVTGSAHSASGSGTGDVHDTVDLSPGDMVIYTLLVTVSGNASGAIDNVANVEAPAGTLDTNPANNTDTDTDTVEPTPVASLRPAFDNVTPTPNASAQDTPPDNGASAFGGHVGDRSAPTDPARNQPRYILRTSSFGQPLARYKASPTMMEEVMDWATNLLFYVSGAPAEQNNAAAFRYINTFFGIGTTGVLDGIQMRLDDSLPYDSTIDPTDGVESDEERALRVADGVINMLRFEPFNKDLRHLLLDIYYYRTLGRQIAAKDQVVRAYQLNFSTEVSQQEPFGGAINKEIAAFTQAAASLSGVLDPYRDLLLNNLGVKVSEFDASFTGNMPFGYYLFATEVPYRSVYAATFVDYDASTGELSGDPQPLDLGDTANYSVLLVSPSGFNVDYTGKPAGSEQSVVSCDVTNVGTAELNWRATIANPTDASGNSTDMLSLRDSDENEALTLSGLVQVGRTTPLSVHIARNVLPTLRVGKMRVEDIGAGTTGLAYDIVIVQAGNEKPIIKTSVTEVVADTSNSPFAQDKQVYIHNGGAGGLHWTATIEADGVATTRPWLEIKGPSDADYGNVAHGTDYGILEVSIGGYIGFQTEPVQIKVSGDDSETEPVYIDAYLEDHPPESGGAAKASGSALLNVYPEEIYAAETAGAPNFAVLNGGAFTWNAAVTKGSSWLSIASADPDSGLVSLSIAANASPASREGVVTISGTGTSPVARTVVVTQNGTGDTGLSVTPAIRRVSATSGVATPAPGGTGFTVARAGNGTVSWTAKVSKGHDWLSIVSGTSGQNEGEVLFSHDLNTRTSARTGEILIESPEAVAGQNEVVVEVIQDGTSGAPVLTAGFKDLSLIYDVMQDEVQVKKELAKRYALRNLDDDLAQARQLIADTLTRQTAALSDLGGVIPNWRHMIDPDSDLLAKYFGWQQAVAELNTTKDFLYGEANILGFQTDFLFLVQQFEGQSEDLFDTFDKLFNYLYDGDNDTAVLASPLGYALSKYLAARAEYDTYRNTQDELREELRTQNIEHRKWMFDVLGMDPGNDVDHPNDAERYRNPAQNYGGQLWQQERSIQRAREQLRRNVAEVESIYGQINTELWRRSQEAQINARIGDVYITFGDKLAAVEEELGAIKAAQAFADNAAEAASAEDAFFSAGASVAICLVNAALQAGAEVAKGFLEGDKHQLAAQENQIIRQLEDQILGVNSQALIANLFGQASVVGMASSELLIALTQEVAARQAMIDEWHYRENLMRENNRALLGRVFADPVFRLRMRRAMIEAEDSFKVAQKWVFYTIRALEYKWNTPFVYSSGTGNWSMSSVYRSRTAKDLLDLMAAVRDFDRLLQGSSRGDDRFDWFSFKKDFFGLAPVYDTDGTTELRVYSHPATGYAATATEAFRYRLEQAYDDKTGTITLPFSTFKDNGETFFRGPRRDRDDPQQVLSRGQYLDKIVWMKVNLLGDFDTSQYQRVMGALTYAGGCYLRNARVGQIPDVTRPDRIVDEFSRWSTRFWFFDSGVPTADPPIVAAWRSSDEQTTEIALSLTEEPRQEIPDSVARIDVFREHSVACDNWTLRIFSRENGVDRIAIDQVDDIEILFYHISKDRPDYSSLKAEEGLGEGEIVP